MDRVKAINQNKKTLIFKTTQMIFEKQGFYKMYRENMNKNSSILNKWEMNLGWELRHNLIKWNQEMSMKYDKRLTGPKIGIT